MKIVLTAREAEDHGIWSELCELSGYNAYALREGMDEDTKIELTLEQAEKLGLVILPGAKEE
jgi:hypothetical protein